MILQNDEYLITNIELKKKGNGWDRPVTISRGSRSFTANLVSYTGPTLSSGTLFLVSSPQRTLNDHSSSSSSYKLQANEIGNIELTGTNGGDIVRYNFFHIEEHIIS